MNIMRIDEQSTSNRTGDDIRRLSEVSGTGTLDGDSEGNEVVSQRGSDSTGSSSERRSRSVQPETPSSDTQFINGGCRYCRHPKAIHFIDVDKLGYWSFCSLSTCDCFLDAKKEDDAPPASSV